MPYNYNDKVTFRSVAAGHVKCRVVSDSQTNGNRDLVLQVSARNNRTYPRGYILYLRSGSYVTAR